MIRSVTASSMVRDRLSATENKFSATLILYPTIRCDVPTNLSVLARLLTRCDVERSPGRTDLYQLQATGTTNQCRGWIDTDSPLGATTASFTGTATDPSPLSLSVSAIREAGEVPSESQRPGLFTSFDVIR